MSVTKFVNSINVAVVGMGYWGTKVASEYDALDTNSSNINVIGKYDLPKGYKEALDDVNINLVHICTPNDTHYKITKDFLKAGKNVLVEKPITLESGKAYELVDLAEKEGLLLKVGHIFRFNNAINKTRSLIRRGYFGDIDYMRVRWTTLMEPPEGRDILFDLAPHPIDMFNYVLDKWPDSVTCKTKAYRRKNYEDMAYIIAEFGDTIGHIEISWLHPPKTRELHIIGQKRSAVIDCLNQKIRVWDGNEFTNLLVRQNNTIKEEISSFVNCVLAGDPVVSTGAIGARTVEIIEAAKESNEDGRTMSVDA